MIRWLTTIPGKSGLLACYLPPANSRTTAPYPVIVNDNHALSFIETTPTTADLPCLGFSGNHATSPPPGPPAPESDPLSPTPRCPRSAALHRSSSTARPAAPGDCG